MHPGLSSFRYSLPNSPLKTRDSCTVQYSTVQYSTVQYSTVQYSTVQYSTVQYSTVQYSTVQYSTVQYSTVQYSTVQYSTGAWLELVQQVKVRSSMFQGAGVCFQRALPKELEMLVQGLF